MTNDKTSRPKARLPRGFRDRTAAEIAAEREYLAVIARVYEHCELELTPTALERMRRWSAANAQHQHGHHVYSLEESGLTRERLDRAFAGYLRAFGSYLDR